MSSSALYNRIFDTKVFLGGSKKKPFRISTFMKLLYDKRNFLVMVFANLIVQLGITYYVFEKTNLSELKGIYLYLIIFALFALLFVLLSPIPMWLKFILFCIFSSLEGFIISSIKTKVDKSLIQTALLGTMSIFAAMFTIGLSLIFFGIYLTNTFGFFLMTILLLLIIFQIISIFSGTITMMQKTFSFIGLILFSIYIIYDTNTILQRNYSGDFITASMDYYLDILNIFLDIVNFNNN
jgi:FtsH-binding integral membrane protein